MTQVDLSKILGVTKATVSLWLGNKVDLTEKNQLKLQYQLASVFDVSPEFIIHGNERKEIPCLSVPILNESTVEDWVLAKEVPKDVSWITCPVRCSEITFCYIIYGTSMDSCGLPCISFPHHSYVFIDPNKPLAVGKFSLFKDKTLVLGAYDELNQQPMLVFNNPRYANIEVVRDNYVGQAIASLQAIEEI